MCSGGRFADLWQTASQHPVARPEIRRACYGSGRHPSMHLDSVFSPSVRRPAFQRSSNVCGDAASHYRWVRCFSPVSTNRRRGPLRTRRRDKPRQCGAELLAGEILRSRGGRAVRICISDAAYVDGDERLHIAFCADSRRRKALCAVSRCVSGGRSIAAWCSAEAAGISRLSDVQRLASRRASYRARGRQRSGNGPPPSSCPWKSAARSWPFFLRSDRRTSAASPV